MSVTETLKKINTHIQTRIDPHLTHTHTHTHKCMHTPTQHSSNSCCKINNTALSWHHKVCQRYSLLSLGLFGRKPLHDSIITTFSVSLIVNDHFTNSELMFSPHMIGQVPFSSPHLKSFKNYNWFIWCVCVCVCVCACAHVCACACACAHVCVCVCSYC